MIYQFSSFMKKILIFSPFFIRTSKSKGFLGGMPLQAYFYAKRYLVKGYEVNVVTLKMPGSLKRELFEGIKITRVGLVNSRVGFEIEEVKEVVDRVRPDIYMQFYSRSGKGEKALMFLPEIKKRFNSECLVRFGRSDEILDLSPVSKKALEEVTSILVNRTMVKSFVKSIPKAKYLVMENKADIKVFYPKSVEEKVTLREKYSIPKNHFVVLFTGRFVENKGVDSTIKALKSIPKSCKVLGLFVGDDRAEKLKGCRGFLEELKKCQDFSPARFRIMGQLDHRDMPEIYNLANVFCLPSRAEGLSNSLLEAEACGLSLLVSALPENRRKGAEVITNLEKQILAKYRMYNLGLDD